MKRVPYIYVSPPTSDAKVLQDLLNKVNSNLENQKNKSAKLEIDKSEFAQKCDGLKELVATKEREIEQLKAKIKRSSGSNPKWPHPLVSALAVLMGLLLGVGASNMILDFKTRTDTRVAKLEQNLANAKVEASAATSDLQSKLTRP